MSRPRLRNAAKVAADVAWEHIRDMPKAERDKRIIKVEEFINGLLMAVIMKTGKRPKA